MTDWLKSWGLPQDQLQDDWKSHRNGFITRRATYRRRPSVRPGDRLFYYAVGHRVVFGLYLVTSLPFQSDEDGEWDWHVNVQPIVDLDALHDGVPLEDLNVGARPHDLLISVRQKAAIRLHKPEADVAEAELRARAGGNNG